MNKETELTPEEIEAIKDQVARDMPWTEPQGRGEE